MIDIISNPWVYGIGVTVIGGLILYFIFGVGKDKKIGNNKNDSEIVVSGDNNITANRDIILNSKDFKNVDGSSVDYFSSKKATNHVYDTSPYQRDSIASSYKGLNVSIMVKLKHITKHTSSKWHLHLEDTDGIWIDCDINPKGYPELKRINREFFRLDGEILEVSVSSISLKNCKLHLKDKWDL